MSITSRSGVILGDEEQFRKYNTLNLYDNSFTDATFEVDEIEKTVVKLNYDACKRATSNKTGEAYYNLGLCHYMGIGTKVNYKDAYKNFVKAANKGYNQGMIAAAECLCKGIGCKKDLEGAINWLRQSAGQGDPTAIYLLGKYLKSNGEDGDALELFKKASELGHEGAMMEICNVMPPKDALFLLIDKYKDGQDAPLRILKDVAVGLGDKSDNAYAIALRLAGDYCCKKEDYIKGYEYYKQAAMKGDEPARFALFLANASGLGTVKNEAASLEHLNTCRGSEAQKIKDLLSKNHGKSLPQVIRSYDPRDLTAYDWRACVLPLLKDQSASARYYVGYHYEKGVGLEQNYKKAVECYTQAANNGFAPAQCRLGLCYDLGYTGNPDPDKAVEWYRKAAEQGNVDAQCNLGYCYAHGNGVKINQQQAMIWYLKAARQNNAVAQYNIGLAYDEGLGVKQDLSKAIEWYTRAANQNFAPAQSNLGYCYVKGRGVAVNKNKGVELLRKAAQQDYEQAKTILYEMGLSL